MFQLSSLNMKEFLAWFVNADIACSQQVIAALIRKTESESSQKFATLSAVTDNFLLRETMTEQIRLALRTSMAVQIYAAGDARAAH